jgi:hypothetical protein
VYDINPSFGGPIRKDRLWFYSAARWQATNRYVAGLWENLNAGNPASWTYSPDFSRQAVFKLDQVSGNTRVTWQATPRNKLNFYFEKQIRDYIDTSALLSPESNSHWIFPRLWTGAAAYTSPITSKLLLEARFASRAEDISNEYPADPNSPYRELIAVTDQGGFIPGLRYRGKGVYSDTSYSTFGQNVVTMWETKVSTSYVTGAHAFKAGFSNLWGQNTLNSFDVTSGTTYRFNNGVPNQIQQRTTTYGPLKGGVRAEMGAFIQDKWTIRRLTLNPGLRFDYFSTGYEPFHLGPDRFAPTRDVTFADTPWYNFKDFSPRMGAVYDLFGNGRTAVKASINRYQLAIFPLDGIVTRDRLVNRVTRSWIDANNNFIPDCDLVNLQAQDLRATGGDACGVVSDLRFGQIVPSTTYDPATLEGWNSRPNNWEFSTGVQHQLAPRIGVEVAYFRRWYGNFRVTDNRAVTAGDFTAFQLTAPSDPRLPGGGGYVVDGLFNLNPDKVGLVDNYQTLSRNFGKQTEHWNGMDFTINARPGSGVLLQGGVSTGRRTTDSCDIRAALPEIDPVNPYCHVTEAFQTQMKFLGTYTLPRVDVLIAATFQSLPGPNILANYVAANAQVQGSLGRPLSGGAANVTVNLVDPGTIYGDRLEQLDLRFTKIVRMGRFRSNLSLDVYNAFNSNVVRSVNNTYSAWMRPTAILDARLFKLGAQVDF